MDQRNQCLAYFAKKLHYITNEDYEKALLSKKDFDNFLTNNDVVFSVTQNLALSLVFVKHCILKHAQQLEYIPENEAKNFLQNKIHEMKKGNISYVLNCIQAGSISMEQFYNIIERLLEQKILKKQESSVLKKIHDSLKHATESSNLTPQHQMQQTQKNKLQKAITDDEIIAPKRQYKPTTTARIAVKQLGPYRILEEIGSGGMGKVYKAYLPKEDKIFAIKVMLRTSETSESERNRFRAEAILTSKLQHNNIVKVYDVQVIDNVDYIVMDYIDGVPLSGVLKGTKLSLRRSLDIIKEIAYAMDYAHNKGVIHRDLKPSNLMIDNKTGHVIIMDFGLAKNTELSTDVTKSGAILGTPRYMAPEQASGKNKKVTATTDVYALGAILYLMISGVPAVRGENPGKIIYNVLHEEIISPKKYNNRLPSKIETICMKALQKDPKLRYPTAEALADDIERYLQGEILSSPGLTVWHQSTKKFKKHRVFILIAAFFLPLIAIIIFLFIKISNVANDNSILRREKEKIVVQNTVQQIVERADNEWLNGYRQKACLMYGKALQIQENHGMSDSFLLKEKLSYSYPFTPTTKEILHVNNMNDMRFSPKESLLIAVGNKGKIFSWNSKVNWTKITNDLKITENLYDLTFHPKGKIIVIAGEKNLYFFEVKTGKLLHKITIKKPIREITSSYNGLYFATRNIFGTIDIWSYKTRKVYHSITNILTPTKISFDSRENILFITTNNGLLHGVNLDLSNARSQRLKIHKHAISDIRIQRKEIITSSLDGTVHFSNTTISPTNRLFFSGRILSIDVSKNAYFLACAKYSDVHIWNLKNNSKIFTLTGHEKNILRLRYNHNGQYLGSLSKDAIFIWQFNTKNKYKVLTEHYSPVMGIHFLKKKNLFLTYTFNGNFHITDNSGNTKKKFKVKKSIGSLSLHASEKKVLISRGNKIYEWDIEKNVQLSSFQEDSLVHFSHYVGPFSFFISLKNKSYIKLPLKLQKIYSENITLSGGEYHEKSKTFMHVKSEKIFLWDSEKTKQLHTINAGKHIKSLCFNEDGSLIAAGFVGQIKIWSTKTAKLVQEIKTKNNSTIRNLVFFKNDIITTDSEGFLSWWDIKTGIHKFILKNHAQDALSIAFGKTKRTIMSGGYDACLVIRKIITEDRFFDLSSNEIMQYLEKNFQMRLIKNEDLELIKNKEK